MNSRFNDSFSRSLCSIISFSLWTHQKPELNPVAAQEGIDNEQLSNNRTGWIEMYCLSSQRPSMSSGAGIVTAGSSAAWSAPVYMMTFGMLQRSDKTRDAHNFENWWDATGNGISVSILFFNGDSSLDLLCCLYHCSQNCFNQGESYCLLVFWRNDEASIKTLCGHVGASF